jgi:hypothetical protein
MMQIYIINLIFKLDLLLFLRIFIAQLTFILKSTSYNLYKFFQIINQINRWKDIYLRGHR